MLPAPRKRNAALQENAAMLNKMPEKMLNKTKSLK